jgi:hypothetical protein
MYIKAEKSPLHYLGVSLNQVFDFQGRDDGQQPRKSTTSEITKVYQDLISDRISKRPQASGPWNSTYEVIATESLVSFCAGVI